MSLTRPRDKVNTSESILRRYRKRLRVVDEHKFNILGQISAQKESASSFSEVIKLLLLVSAVAGRVLLYPAGGYQGAFTALCQKCRAPRGCSLPRWFFRGGRSPSSSRALRFSAMPGCYRARTGNGGGDATFSILHNWSYMNRRLRFLRLVI